MLERVQTTVVEVAFQTALRQATLSRFARTRASTVTTLSPGHRFCCQFDVATFSRSTVAPVDGGQMEAKRVQAKGLGESTSCLLKRFFDATSLTIPANLRLTTQCGARAAPSGYIRVLTSHTFQDAQEVARNEFSLTGDLVFETDDIQGFEDTHVRIHQAAWQGISPVLRSVTIKLSNSSSPAAVARPRPSETLSSGSRRLSSQKRMSMTGPPPVRLSGAPSTLAPAARIVERQSLSARKSPLPTSSSSSQFPSMPAYKESGPSSYKSSPPSRQSPAPTPTPAPIEELDDDEEEVRLLSPKKKNTRPRVMSDYGIDRAEETDELHEDARKASGETGDDEDFDQLDDAEFMTSVGPSTRSQPRTSKTSRTSSASIVELDGPPAGWADKTERAPGVRQLDAPLPEPKVKKEKIEPKLERLPSEPKESWATSSQSQPASKSDESFLIMIEYADNPDSRSLFKTRARHMVSKVLMQACRTFELQAYYHSARLVLVAEEVDEETGEVAYRYRHTCGRHETMGEAGAVPDAKFLVEIAEEEEDEE